MELGRDLSDLQLLAKLQHLGAATGLLDFSWNPLVGLWFACEEPDAEGKLFVINLNDPIQVAMISKDDVEQRASRLFLPGEGPPSMAYWEPTASGDASARILRQRSVFVIGRPNMPEDSNIIAGIIIAQEDKNELIRELGLLDVSHRSLFMDAHGFAENNGVAYPISLSQDDYLIAGNRYYQQGAFRYAIEAYSKFVDLNPDHYRIYFLRGNAHAELRNHVEAIEDYGRALSTMARFPQSIVIDHMIYFNRANSRVELEDYAGAVKDYLQAIGLVPDPTHYRFNLANTYFDALCFEDAISAYEEVGAANWHAMFNKGNALMCLGKFSDARESYIEAAARAPDNETVNQNLWTSSRLLELLTGLKIVVHLDASRMHLEIRISPEDSVPELHQYQYIVAGKNRKRWQQRLYEPGWAWVQGKRSHHRSYH